MITLLSLEGSALSSRFWGMGTGLRARAITEVISRLPRLCRITSRATYPVAPEIINFMIATICY